MRVILQDLLASLTAANVALIVFLVVQHPPSPHAPAPSPHFPSFRKVRGVIGLAHVCSGMHVPCSDSSRTGSRFLHLFDFHRAIQPTLALEYTVY